MFVLSEVVRDTADATVHLCATECLGVSHFTRGCFHEGGTTEEHFGLVLDVEVRQSGDAMSECERCTLTMIT